MKYKKRINWDKISDEQVTPQMDRKTDTWTTIREDWLDGTCDYLRK